MRRAGAWLLGAIAMASLLAPWLSPHDPSRTFRTHQAAPPTALRVVDADGRWRAPFFYPLVLVNRLERRYEEDRSRPVALEWFARGRLAGEPAESAAPWLPLGADPSGRDVLSRLLAGGRISLGVALVAALGALVAGAAVGGVSGYLRGWPDDLLMRAADFLLLLPALYVVLALRAALPLVLAPWTTFALVTAILLVLGWPIVARGVRAIVVTEASREYVEAARALGAPGWRIVLRHLLPATRGFLATQATLLVPAFVLAEATLSFVGLGFPDTAPSWGTMLQDAADVTILAEFPWLLAPAGAIVLVTLAVNLAVGDGD